MGCVLKLVDTIVEIICDLIDKIRPDLHKIMADGVALFLAGMGEAKDIEDQTVFDFHKKRRLIFRSKGGSVIPARQVIHPGIKLRKFTDNF